MMAITTSNSTNVKARRGEKVAMTGPSCEDLAEFKKRGTRRIQARGAPHGRLNF
jgi:hypothetical protein